MPTHTNGDCRRKRHPATGRRVVPGSRGPRGAAAERRYAPQPIAGRTGRRHRPVRRNRFRLLLRRLSGSRLQESGVGVGRKAVVRDLSFVAGHAGRSSALAAERQRALARTSATPPNPSSATWTRTAICRHRWKRSPPWASTAWSRSRRRCKVVQSLDPAGVGARNLRECLLLRTREPQRARRRGLADRLQPSEAAGNAAVSGTGQGAGPADGAHRDRRAK